MSEPSPLRLEGVVKRFGDVVAVDGVDLTLGDSELLALVGPSGCGKSTLLRIIAGLVKTDQGRVLLRGDLVDDGTHQIPPERRRVGLVFQEHALFPHLTVAENVGFGVKERADRRADRARAMLELVSLGGFGDRYPHELSGGERQRVALARALAPEPALMLFDEPFASLDHNLRIQLRADVVGALRSTNTPAVFVTHDQSEALAIGDRIAVMRRGRPAQVGTPAEVFHRPIDRFVGSFMGEASFLRIDAESGVCATTLGPVEIDRMAAASGRWAAMVRPDDIRFEPDAGGTAEVVSAEYRGVGWLVTVALADGQLVLAHTSHLTLPRPADRGIVRLNDGHRQVPVMTD